MNVPVDFECGSRDKTSSFGFVLFLLVYNLRRTQLSLEP